MLHRLSLSFPTRRSSVRVKGPGEELLKNWLESHRGLLDSFHDDLISAYRLVSTEGAARPVSYDYGIAGDGASDRLSVNAKGTTHIASGTGEDVLTGGSTSSLYANLQEGRTGEYIYPIHNK